MPRGLPRACIIPVIMGPKSSLAPDTGGHACHQRVPTEDMEPSALTRKSASVGSCVLGLSTGFQFCLQKVTISREDGEQETVSEQRREFARMFLGVSPRLVYLELWPGSPLLFRLKFQSPLL